MKKVVVFMADGMEECECLIAVDLLKRAGIKVITASVMGREAVVSTHDIMIAADCLADDLEFANVDAVVLPGGLPGADYLRDNAIVEQTCKDFAKAGKIVAAICAAPRNLASFGLLDGKSATIYPGMEGDLVGAKPTGEAVVTAGNIITGRALGSAIPFALEIIKQLVDAKTAEKVAQSIVY